MTRSAHEFDGKLVFIMSCADCNVKCKHCYLTYSNSLDGNSLYNIASILSERYEVRINGSEPLLHADYLKTLKKVGQYSVMTNGLVFKDNYEYIEEVKKTGIKELAISYHFELHDEISMVPRAFLEELFCEILKRGLRVRVNCSLSKRNFRNIADHCNFCLKLGIQKIRFTNFLKQGNADDLDDETFLSDADRTEFFELIESVRKDIPKEILEIERCGSFGRNPKKQNFYCGGGINNIALLPDLKVYPCVFLMTPENEIGFFEDGKIYIYDDFVYSNKDCLALLKLNG